jgi:hypothetical protein
LTPTDQCVSKRLITADAIDRPGGEVEVQRRPNPQDAVTLRPMKTLIAGSAQAASALAERLADEGIDARTSTPEGGGDAIQALAASLVELESRIEADRPEIVLLADRGDHALAAALVATKLLVPVTAVADAGNPGEDGPSGGENARLLELLADEVEIGALPTLLRP